MAGKQAIKSLLNSNQNRVTLSDELHVMVSRKALETEHRQLLSRLAELRRLLDYPPLLTGKQQRRATDK